MSRRAINRRISQQAAEDRAGLMPYLNTHLVFDPFRADPRFQALLQRMNFPA